MLNNKLIFIASPAYYASGGPELLHQLHYEFRIRGLNSYIYYYGIEINNKKSPIPERFTKYVKPNEYVDNILDVENNVLIVPETYPYILNLKNIEVWLWWLSVDFFFISRHWDLKHFTEFSVKQFIKKVIKRYPFNEFQQILKAKTIKKHFYQSEYAKLFLNKFKLNPIEPLFDYINDDVISNNYQKKEDIVLYNPAKGFKTIKYFIDKTKATINWIPIQNMNPNELKGVMSKSKLYIDFGFHPGKDRIPRESVLNGCCVITNREGAALNDFDILIPSKYKFLNPIKSEDNIVTLIQDILKNYDNHFIEFLNYRDKILNEKLEFTYQVDALVKSLKN